MLVVSDGPLAAVVLVTVVMLVAVVLVAVVVLAAVVFIAEEGFGCSSSDGPVAAVAA